jgi:tetratricopeptide (TPR) repeat protein
MPLAAMLAALIIAGCLAYSNSLSSPFLLDDEDSIVRNPHVTSLALPQALQAPPQGSLAGRPLPALSMAVSYSMGGLDPAAYHAWNLAVLIASALLLFSTVRVAIAHVSASHLEERDTLAFCIAMLWLLHPINTEVVDYVTQRTESMMGLAYIATFYCSLRSIDTGARQWTIAATLCCAAGMACKESMVTAPVMVLLYDAAFVTRSIRSALTRRPLLYSGLACGWILLLILNAGGPRSGSAGIGTVSAATYLLNQGPMIARYLWLSIWPAGLVADYGRTRPIEWAVALPYVVFVGGVIAAVAIAWLKRRWLPAFLGSWLLVTLAPTSSLIAIATEVGAERRMYLGEMAIVTLFVVLLRLVLTRTATLVAAATVALLFGVLTYARNAEYHDPITLWQTVIDRHRHGRAYYNEGLALKAAGRTSDAIAAYRRAVPDEPAAYYALGFEASEAKRPREAIELLEEFLRRRPVDPMRPGAGVLLGQALIDAGRPADAERVLRETLELAPGNADALGTLADAVVLNGRYDEAISLYRRYLNAVPNAFKAHYSLGVALARTGHETQAVDEFERALPQMASNPVLRLSLGSALDATGRTDEAIAQYREGLRLDPENPVVMSALALALAKRGEYSESDLLFLRALRAAPDDESIRQDFDTAKSLRRR